MRHDGSEREKLIYSVLFRRMFEHEVRHYRMEFARMELENGETNIVAGVRDVDAFVQHVQQEQLS